MARDFNNPEDLFKAFDRVAMGAHKGAVKGYKKASSNIEAVSKKYCTPGESPYDDMVFPTKVDKSGNQRSGAPFDIGNLRRLMYSKVEETEDEIKGIVGNTAGAAIYVFLGTSVMQARPVIERAIADEQERTLEFIKEETWKGITEASLL